MLLNVDGNDISMSTPSSQASQGFGTVEAERPVSPAGSCFLGMLR